MRKKQLKLQIILISIGCFLIFLTYFLPNINKGKNSVIDNQTKKEDLSVVDQTNDTTFEKVEYQGLYDFNKKFTVTSEEAIINKEDPDLVYMTKMHVILNLSDGRVVHITSSVQKCILIQHYAIYVRAFKYAICKGV